MAETTNKAKKGRISSYFREMKSEYKKISWPSFKQVKGNTGIVLAFIIALGVFIAIIDFALTYLFSFLK